MVRNVVKVIKDKDNTAQILVKGTSTAMMNAIRRTVMSEVPTLAVEELAIYENNGVLFDEFLGHRLGLIPISTDPKTYKLGDKVKVTLDVSGPGTVYSKELKIADSGLKVLDENIPITKLKADQKIRIEAEAIAGQGKDHVKFQPAIIGFRPLPLFTIGEKVENEKAQKIVESCPVNIIEMKGGKLSITESSDCTLCGACEEIGGSENIQVDPDETGFMLMVEGAGTMSTKDLIDQAFKILTEKTNEFEKEVKEGL
jgi:DNA-directed RNA polymerase subunit D